MKLLQAGILTISVMLSVTMIASSQDMFSKKQPSLKLGEKLPDLEVTTQNGKQVKLEAAKGHRWVFVFFYPKALTGG